MANRRYFNETMDSMKPNKIAAVIPGREAAPPRSEPGIQ
jgi:hypothetical protein